VDAAGALPPAANLRRFIEEGADLVAFSGGKAIGGPQASGILCGRAGLIRAVALQHQDMDVHPGVWRYRSMIEDGTLPGPPHHGIGRPMKVGKETIVGLVVALERFVTRDEVAEGARQAAVLETIARRLDGIPGVDVDVRLASPAGRPSYSSLVVDVGGDDPVGRACAIVLALEAGDPSIHVGQAYLDSGQLSIIPTTLRLDEAEIVAQRLRALLT
jgi:L-seryl-tRNA(Ser) seleniumtransferase